jgi:PAS domain S-box-containing protein
MEGKTVYFNPAFTSVFGWTLEERLDQKMDDFVPEEAWLKTKVMIDMVLAGESFSGIETRRYTKEGNIINVSLSGAIYKDQDGNSMGSIIILRDISEQKKLEAQLQRAQKMEALGILAGGVAHDLNNVLSGIVSYPDLLLKQIPEDSPLIKPMLTMQDSGKKAANIVQDLLTLARRGVVVEEVVNLNEIISEHLKNPEHEKLKSFHPRVEVETSLESDLFNISGSPVHLSKTVMNLVSNAAEAMADGGKVFISTENRYIDRPISSYDSIEEGDYVTLTVSDTGVGISPEDNERIFEPFYTKKVMGRSGTGLGMAVVWGTVKDHKGYIDVQSTEGKGTTFTLYFPATRRARDKEKTILPIENYMGKGESILVVDDAKQQREIVFNLLTTLGYIVDTVSSGEKAVDYMKNKTADLLILDMIMDPGIDGLDTYKKIIEIHPGQKAIIASGFSETYRVREAQKLGAGQYIKKPYTLGKIGIAVRDELDK